MRLRLDKAGCWPVFCYLNSLLYLESFFEIPRWFASKKKCSKLRGCLLMMLSTVSVGREPPWSWMRKPPYWNGPGVFLNCYRLSGGEESETGILREGGKCMVNAWRNFKHCSMWEVFNIDMLYEACDFYESYESFPRSHLHLTWSALLKRESKERVKFQGTLFFHAFLAGP